MPLMPGGEVLDIRPGNMQPLGFDATTSNSNGLFLMPPDGMGGGGLNLLEELFGEDFELTERDPSECEACENCLQCIDCSNTCVVVGILCNFWRILYVTYM